jgi:hypothetical protein
VIGWTTLRGWGAGERRGRVAGGEQYGAAASRLVSWAEWGTRGVLPRVNCVFSGVRSRRRRGWDLEANYFDLIAISDINAYLGYHT